MRNTTILPLNSEESLIIASDNSGAIGEKEQDEVNVPYETIAYYAFRVAVMECMAAGGDPFAVILHNFCGNGSWNKLVSGVKKGLSELEIDKVKVTGSTESNFNLAQSAIGVIVLGKSSTRECQHIQFPIDTKFAVLGRPLVGDEVMTETDQVIPLSIMKSIFKMENTTAWPVGSKGILYELIKMNRVRNLSETSIQTDVDVLKSAGPSTCVIVGFREVEEQNLRAMTGELYHPLTIKMEE
ncbi:ATP-binding protein [Alkalihalobacillus sp. AL-G]|uniref:ATP-binding protein n=1 Tax=Alkalihalobacillus sp. AL-G TaxID=2926399 RepID=UPI002729E2D6|nr:ATP-binding protein [Alkalihalobacillus sp. AL-G]WLD91669.1 ATP-binding protein [Alkalihalobacillus sp. AL-G]